MPAALELRRYLHLVEGPVAGPAGVDHVRSEIVGHGAGVAVDFDPVARSERVDAAELENAFRAVRELAEHRQHVGHDDFVAVPDRVQDFAPRENAGDVPEPALENLDVDAEGENVQPADLDPLPPMRWRVCVEVGAGETLEPDVVRMAEVIFGEQF